MLYPVDEEHHLIKSSDARDYGIPLLKWFLREKDGLGFFCTLRYLDPDLNTQHHAKVHYYRAYGVPTVEFWFGKQGFSVIFGIRFPWIRFKALKEDPFGDVT